LRYYVAKKEISAMPMTKAERLKILEEKQEQIRAQIQALRARDVAQERKNETRRKILLGGLIFKMVKEGKLTQAQLTQWLESGIKAERDRALFGLADLSALSPSGEALGAVSNG
jgi:large subunit ribosomal protein L7/L12